MYMQMYKVYQDPQGEHYLDQTEYPQTTMKRTATMATTEDDNYDYYKQRILSLNEEIKTLNNEVATVSLYAPINLCIFTHVQFI